MCEGAEAVPDDLYAWWVYRELSARELVAEHGAEHFEGVWNNLGHATGGTGGVEERGDVVRAHSYIRCERQGRPCSKGGGHKCRNTVRLERREVRDWKRIGVRDLLVQRGVDDEQLSTGLGECSEDDVETGEVSAEELRSVAKGRDGDSIDKVGELAAGQPEGTTALAASYDSEHQVSYQKPTTSRGWSPSGARVLFQCACATDSCC